VRQRTAPTVPWQHETLFGGCAAGGCGSVPLGVSCGGCALGAIYLPAAYTPLAFHAAAATGAVRARLRATRALPSISDAQTRCFSRGKSSVLKE